MLKIVKSLKKIQLIDLQIVKATEVNFMFYL